MDLTLNYFGIGVVVVAVVAAVDVAVVVDVVAVDVLLQIDSHFDVDAIDEEKKENKIEESEVEEEIENCGGEEVAHLKR